MNRSSVQPVSEELSFCAWFGFWAQFAVLGFLAIVGAFYAGEADSPGDYACGLILTVAAIALGFMRLKHRLDGGPPGWGSFLLVNSMAGLVAAIVAFTILGLAGLFIAEGAEHGGLHNAGVALFIASGLAVFLSMKHVFDTLERRH